MVIASFVQNENPFKMKVNSSSARWNGTLKDGNGTMSFKGFEHPFTFASRFETGPETNPEELIGGAIAGCYSMFLSALLSGKGFSDQVIDTTAEVTLDKDDIGPRITEIKLITNVTCTDLDQNLFEELTATAKEKCPVSRLYSGSTAEILLEASLN